MKVNDLDTGGLSLFLVESDNRQMNRFVFYYQ